MVLPSELACQGAWAPSAMGCHWGMGCHGCVALGHRPQASLCCGTCRGPWEPEVVGGACLAYA